MEGSERKGSGEGVHLPARRTFPLCHQLPLNRVTVLPTQAKTLSPARWILLYILCGQFRSRTFLDQRNVNRLFTHLWSGAQDSSGPGPGPDAQRRRPVLPFLPPYFLSDELPAKYKPPSPKDTCPSWVLCHHMGLKN